MNPAQFGQNMISNGVFNRSTSNSENNPNSQMSYKYGEIGGQMIKWKVQESQPLQQPVQKTDDCFQMSGSPQIPTIDLSDEINQDSNIVYKNQPKVDILKQKLDIFKNQKQQIKDKQAKAAIIQENLIVACQKFRNDRQIQIQKPLENQEKSKPIKFCEQQPETPIIAIQKTNIQIQIPEIVQDTQISNNIQTPEQSVQIIPEKINKRQSSGFSDTTDRHQVSETNGKSHLLDKDDSKAQVSEIKQKIHSIEKFVEGKNNPKSFGNKITQNELQSKSLHHHPMNDFKRDVEKISSEIIFVNDPLKETNLKPLKLQNKRNSVIPIQETLMTSPSPFG